MNINIENIYYNNKGEPYKIIEYLGNDNNSHADRYKIKFIKSGGESEVYYSNMKTGRVSDPLHGIPMFTWLHSKNFGDYMIIEVIHDPKYYYIAKCKWKDTGSESYYRFDHARFGDIKDYYRPIICGVAYHGEYNGYEEPWAYNMWKHMIERCYSKKDSHYNSYGELGVKVCDRWFNYSNFIVDMRSLYNYNKKVQFPNEYELDKDMLQKYIPKEQRVYSPQTCMFIHKNLNEYLRYNSSSEPLKDNEKIQMYRLI